MCCYDGNRLSGQEPQGKNPKWHLNNERSISRRTASGPHRITNRARKRQQTGVTSGGYTHYKTAFLEQTAPNRSKNICE